LWYALNSSSSSSSSLSSSTGTGAGVGAAGAVAFLGGAFANIAAMAPAPFAAGRPAGFGGASLGFAPFAFLSTGLNPANAPEGLEEAAAAGSALEGAVLALAAAGAGLFASAGEDVLGLAETRRAGPSSRFADAHLTAECLLSRSALGVLGDASNIASVCATHAGGRDLAASPPTAASFASTGRTE